MKQQRLTIEKPARGRFCGIAIHMTCVVLALVQVGCQTAATSRQPAMTAAEVGRALPRDARALKRIEKDNALLQQGFLALQEADEWKVRGCFSAEESDRVELLLFRFHTAHQQLSDIRDRYAGMESQQAQELRSQAGSLAKKQAGFLVRTFAGDRVAMKKLNQPYPRSEIPRNTYDRMAGNLRTKVEREMKALGREIGDGLDKSSYELRAETFLRVSRLKKPSAYVVRFNEAQKEEVQAQLQPGDLVLTYTGGYASNIFVPGSFKHVMTYIGTPEKRRAAGFSPERLVAASGVPRERGLAVDLRRKTTSAGLPANVIEAVGEGVKFSNLEHIMETHIWTMLVIRPQLDSRDRARQLGRTFSYLGQEYDFRFDFSDSSRQVCTEVVYRSLNGIRGIDFPLTRRGGHVTLSADDLVGYWLEERPEAFELVLYAEEAPRSAGHAAQVLYGEAGKKRLAEVMRKGE
jgi:hypothetical protein